MPIFDEIISMPNIGDTDSQGFPYIDVEDGGAALIYQIEKKSKKEEGLFVRLQSWDEDIKHKDFRQLLGKRLRVRIEIV